MPSDREQINQLKAELEKVITRFRMEYEISYAATIGVLQIMQIELCQELLAIEEDEP